MLRSFATGLLLLLCCHFGHVALAQPVLKLGTFDVDASPAVGSPLAYDPTKEVTLPLSCRGIVLVGADAPIVLCAVDWIGIGNDGQRAFREALARAAGTTPERVAVHTLHQHDAPRCDFTADQLLAPFGINHLAFDVPFARNVIARAATACARAVEQAQPVTHLGVGKAEVHEVASNRRILGPDGKVKSIRWSATRDPAVRAEPVGTIDADLRMISFWYNDRPLAALSYYATHPQSYYRTGGANPDFPGMARNQRQTATGVPHIHFNGAGGNITAGKWNDGSTENRQLLADRVADGMARAWQATEKFRLSADEVRWQSIPVALPVATHLDEQKLVAVLENAEQPATVRATAANDLAWLRRCRAGDTIDVSCLTLGTAHILHLPGELFVEYQLAAQQMKPEAFVALAAYGDYAPGYIGTEIAYSQGGYETGPNASLVDATVEGVLLDALRKLLP